MPANHETTLKILFISHDASRTGAPLVLLDIMTWLKQNTNWELNCLLGNGGPLYKDFSEVARTFDRTSMYVAPRANLDLKTILTKVRNLAVRKLLRRKTYSSPAKLRIPVVDLIYSNTVVNGNLLEALQPLRAPVISHIHEMRHSSESFGQQNWAQIAEYTDKYIAVSNAVKCHLKEKGIPANKIRVIYPSFSRRHTSADEKKILSLRTSLGIEENSEVLLGCGANYWTKGVDHFVTITSILKHRYGRKRIRAFWIGGNETDIEYRRVQFEARMQKIDDCFQIISHVDNPLDYINLATVFCMTSREDSFPLVNLEASFLQKPIICFRQSGGSVEFLNGNLNYTADYPDCNEFAKKVLSLLDNPRERQEVGHAGRERVLTHFSSDNHNREIKEEILSVAGKTIHR
jgi:glycosyltransferase involved in cell wall biosynthesis